ncbi:hypothetical protein EVAR_26846_1 [Eumeta japonica]|uniref:Uncharacterized protein n=1 Tax=Eumeta variegata TaxID=151549 RepID=A0A4C1VWI4_EUMVA|nr:hypothetical protein EVAR_26846_1 [Eumeta japonica]
MLRVSNEFSHLVSSTRTGETSRGRWQEWGTVNFVVILEAMNRALLSVYATIACGRVTDVVATLTALRNPRVYWRWLYGFNENDLLSIPSSIFEPTRRAPGLLDVAKNLIKHTHEAARRRIKLDVPRIGRTSPEIKSNRGTGRIKIIFHTYTNNRQYLIFGAELCPAADTTRAYRYFLRPIIKSHIKSNKEKVGALVPLTMSLPNARVCTSTACDRLCTDMTWAWGVCAGARTCYCSS